jgi:hypothetical protein
LAAAFFTLTNSGPQTIAGSVDAPCSGFQVQGPSSYSLAPGQSATCSIVFRPRVTGPQECAVATGIGQTVVCRGTGDPAVPILPTTWSAIKALHR